MAANTPITASCSATANLTRGNLLILKDIEVIFFFANINVILTHAEHQHLYIIYKNCLTHPYYVRLYKNKKIKISWKI